MKNRMIFISFSAFVMSVVLFVVLNYMLLNLRVSLKYEGLDSDKQIENLVSFIEILKFLAISFFAIAVGLIFTKLSK